MKAANTMEVRQQNALYIMRDIECFPGITIAEIAKNREVSVATVSNIVNLLKAGGFITAAGAAVSSGGRRPVQLSVSADYQKYLGVSVAGHTVYLVLTDFAGTILKKERFYREYAGTKEYWSGVAALAEEFCGEAYASCLTGIALPGFVDEERGIVTGTETLGVPVVLLEDVRAAFGEDVSVGDAGMLAGLAQTFGKADYPDSFFILLSRRISGFPIRSDELIRTGGSGVDVGAMILDPRGTTRDYGIPGSFLELCSASRIIDLMKRRGAAEAGYEAFFRDIAGGNEEYRALWDEYLGYLALALCNLRAAYGIGLVIGGEMAGYISEYAEELEKKAAAFAPAHGRNVSVSFSSWGEYDDACGAALAARHEHVTGLIPTLMKGAPPHTVRGRKRRSAS